MFCKVTFVKLTAIFLKKKSYEWVYEEEFFNKTDSFSKRL